MDDPNENPSIVETLAGETKEGLDDAAALPGRLDRYSRAHHRALEASDYAMTLGEVKISRRLQFCGSYLVFRDYFTVGKVRLHCADFCHLHLLCPLCAIRRGAKMVKSYLERLAIVLTDDVRVRPYMVTLTVKDGPDLVERYEHLHRSLQRYHEQRKHAMADIRREPVEACKATGGVLSYEFKRGAGSRLWHPHLHAVWMCVEAPDQDKLAREWYAITGDSYIVDVRQISQDPVPGFLEVFKYAVKFSDMPMADNWDGYEYLRGRRLVSSFGVFRGIELPDKLTDDDLADDLPYIEMLYRFARGVGYDFLGTRLAFFPSRGVSVTQPHRVTDAP